MGVRISPNGSKTDSWKDDYPMTYLFSFSDERDEIRRERGGQMNEKISDERLKCFVQGVDLENITPNDEISMAVELLSLRSLNKRLAEDGGLLSMAIFGLCGGKPDGKMKELLDQHAALMKEIGG